MDTTTSDSSPAYQGYHPERAEAIRTKFLRYRTVFLTYWWILALTVSIGIAIQGWTAFTKPAVYQSTGRIIVSGRIAIPEGALFSEEAMNFMGTQIELMQSDEVRQRAAQRVQSRRPDLTPVPVSIDIGQIPKTSIFVLTATGTAPEYVKAYLDAVMESYIDLRRGIFSEKSQSTLTAITDELTNLEGQLRKGEDDLLTWQRENNLVLLDKEGQFAGAYLAELNQKLAAFETEYNLLDQLTVEQNIDRIKLSEKMDGAPTDVPDPAVNPGDYLNTTGGVAQDYMNARQRLLMLQAEREKFLVDFMPDHPKVKNIEGQITQQQRLMDILRKQGSEQFKSRKEALGIQIQNTKAQIATWEERALGSSRRVGEYERLKGKVDRQKSLYERLLASVQSVDVNSNIQQDIVSIMEYASPPSYRIVDAARELISGGLLGALAGAGILFIIGLLDDRIMSVSELQSVLEEEVVGVIPKVPEGQSLISAHGVDQPAMAEAFRNIRSWIMLTPWEGAKPKTIVLTSAIPEEGKSTVASNLAVTLAASGANTLLVDADLRRGKMHKLFQINLNPGLGNFLSGEISFDQAIYSVDVERLQVVPRGEYMEQSTEAFISRGLDHFFNQVVPKYDYVVIDTGPALAVDDTSTLASKADLVLMVVRSSFTGIRLARKALGLLHARHAQVEGIIYNAVDWSAAEYPYYHYNYREVENQEAKT